MSTSHNQALEEQKKMLRWPILRRVLVLIAILASVPAFYALENWRGNRAWNQYCQTAKERGYLVEVPLPKPAPAAGPQGLEAPYEKEFDRVDSVFQQAEALIKSRNSLTPERALEDLTAWGQALAWVRAGRTSEDFQLERDNTNAEAQAQAAVILLGSFAEHDAFFEKLRLACGKPDFTYPLGFNSSTSLGPMPLVANGITVCQRLRLKTSAQLALGRNAEALRELELMLRLGDSLGRHPSLIAAVGKFACRGVAVESFREAFADRRFNEHELQQLQRLLNSGDLMAELSRAFRNERGQMLGLFDWLEKTRRWDMTFECQSSQIFTTLFGLMPAGWLQLEKLNYAKGLDEMLTAGFDGSGKCILPGALDVAQENVQKRVSNGHGFTGFRNHTAIAGIVMPRLPEITLNSSATQVSTDQIRIGCGLELYFMKHGSYPEDLARIVPEFLAQMPTDPLSGEPYHYARQQNGRWKLWSVGWNEKDDDGVSGGERFGRTGDWVGPVRL